MMQLLGDVFGIVVFLSFAGGLYASGLFICKRALCFALPFWTHAVGIGLFAVPVVLPGAVLFPPEAAIWIPGYVTASIAWAVGAAAALLLLVAVEILSLLKVRELKPCRDARLVETYRLCAQTVGVRRLPELLSGAFGGPAGVVVLLRPVVVIDEEMLGGLSDKELVAVLCHELTHVKRGHHVAKRTLDLCTILHWFNPLMWLFRRDFLLGCETDCDRRVCWALSESCSRTEYAKALLLLWERAGKHAPLSGATINALGYVAARRRLSCIVREPSRARKAFAIAFATACLAATVAVSGSLSEGYFYPYAQHGAEGTVVELVER